MNKKIIAIAIASALAAPVAMADVTVNGALGGDLVSRNDASALTSTNTTDTTAGTIAIEDWGATKVDFNAKTGNVFGKLSLNMGPGANAGTAPSYRDYFIGYNFGGGASFQFGVMAGAAKNLEKDAYIASFLQTRGTFAEARTSGAYGSSSFIHNVLQFKFKAGPGTLAVQYDPTDNVNSSDNSGHAGVAYSGKAGGADFYASYNNGAGDESANSQSNMKLGGGMKFGTIKAGLTYTSADDGAVTWSAISAGATFDFGNSLGLNVNYGVTTGDATKDGDSLRLAVTKGLGKGAKVYGGYTSHTPDGGETQTMVGFGMGIKF